jgi:hypothetical protein
MAPLLLLPPILGWMLARRVLGLRDPLLAGFLALGLAVSLLLLGGNALIRFTGTAAALGWTFAAMGVGLLFLWRRPAEPLEPVRMGRWTWTVLVLATLAILAYAQVHQNHTVDDDFFIHAPQQVQMGAGRFPPPNPFIPQLEMHGHYGSDLLIGLLHRASGVDVVTTKRVLTSLLQVVGFWLLFAVVRRATDSELQGCLAAILVYFGINVGGRGGVMDTVENYNPLVHEELVLCMALLLGLWRRPTWGSALLTGAVLGGYAVIYETHLALVVLAALATLVVLRPSRKALALTGLALVVAGGLAVTQGGPLTDIFQRAVGGGHPVDGPGLSKALQNQSQRVTIRFPKENLFQILLEPGEYQRISGVYKTDTFLRRFYSPPEGRGYRNVWSPDVLRLHWLPLFLAPLSLAFAVRKRSAPALFMGAFGLFSFLVPALVDFGPVYESEYYRWEVAAGVGLAGALGVAAGWLFEFLLRACPGPAITCEGGSTVVVVGLRPRGFVLAGLLGFVWLATLTSGQYLKDLSKHPPVDGRWLAGLVRFIPLREFFLHQESLDFEPVDWEAATRLAKLVRPGDGVLSDFRTENSYSIYFSSVLSVTTAALPVGHAMPVDSDPIGTYAFRMNAPALAFWSTQDPRILRSMPVRWVYERRHPSLQSGAGLDLVFRQTGEGGSRRVFRVDLEPLSAGPLVKEASVLRLVGVEAPGRARAQTCHIARVTLENASPSPFSARDLALFWVARRAEGDYETPDLERILMPVDLALAPGERAVVELPLVVPPLDGTYHYSFYLGSERATHRLEGQDCTVIADAGARVTALRMSGMDLREGFAEAVLANPSDRPLELDEGLLASVAFWKGSRYVDRPGTSLVSVGLAVPAFGEAVLRLPVVLPRIPGRYRMDLLLAPREGPPVLLEGPEVDVR